MKSTAGKSAEWVKHFYLGGGLRVPGCSEGAAQPVIPCPLPLLLPGARGAPAGEAQPQTLPTGWWGELGTGVTQLLRLGQVVRDGR